MTRSNIDSYAAALARLILGGFFIVSGLNNLINIFATAEKIDIPGGVLLIVIGALFKIIFGTALALRYHTKYASIGLAIYLGIISMLFYGPSSWTEENLYSFIFTRNLAIIGGLLFVYAHSRGFNRWQEEFMPKKQQTLIKNAWKHKHPHQ